MSAQPFTLNNFEVLNRYRMTLQSAFDTMERVKSDLGLTSNQAFIRLHQASLENTLYQANAQLRNWPDVLEWPYRIFYQQSDLVTDIRRFELEFSRVLSKMTRIERKGLLSTLDFSRAPFELNGRLKVLSATPGYPFALQAKQQVFDLWLNLDRAAFTTSDLYMRASLILPRLIDFLQGAIDAYAVARKLDRRGNDRNIVAVRAIIEKTTDDQISLADATRELSEGYADLASFMSGALSEFKDLFTSVSIERFQDMIDGAMPRFELAEELITHTKK